MTMVLLLIGLALMIVNTVYGTRLRALTSGGVIGERMLQLVAMIGVFAGAYLVVGALVYGKPADTSLILLAAILLMGAVFVTLVLRLVQEVLQALA